MEDLCRLQGTSIAFILSKDKQRKLNSFCHEHWTTKGKKESESKILGLGGRQTRKKIVNCVQFSSLSRYQDKSICRVMIFITLSE